MSEVSLKFPAEITRDCTDFKKFFSSFGHTGSTKFCETLHVKSLAPSEDIYFIFTH